VFHIKQWQRSGDAILSDLSRRFISRRMFKAIDLDMPHDHKTCVSQDGKGDSRAIRVRF
jgi:hypothetical protein